MYRRTLEEIQARENRKREMEKLYESGMTHAEIGREFGISRQRVFQLIGGKTRHHYRIITKELCVYDGLRDWLNENRVSIGELTRRIYGEAHAVARKRISDKLGGAIITKTYIDKILKVTGLTYEEAFRRSDSV